MINVILGTGGDYSNFGSFIDNNPTIADNYNLTISGTVTEVSSVSIPYENGYTLSIGGDIETSIWDLNSYSINWSRMASAVTIGTLNLSGCEIYDGQLNIFPANLSCTFNLVIHHNYFHNTGIYLTVAGGGMAQGSYLIYNNKFYDATTSKQILQIEASPYYTSNLLIENNTFYKGSRCIKLDNGDGWILRNNLTLSAATSNILFTNVVSLSYYSNGDSNNTWPDHTGYVSGVNSSNFISLDDTSDNFLKPLSSSATDLNISGASPVSALDDYDGNNRPGVDSYYSIGCYEYMGGVTGLVVTPALVFVNQTVTCTGIFLNATEDITSYIIDDVSATSFDHPLSAGDSFIDTRTKTIISRGIFTIYYNISDSTDNIISAFSENISANPLPEVGFTGYPYALSALSFYDVKGGYYITDTVVSADWDFGDGSLSSTTDLDAILIHSYSAVGNYTVSVSAYDVSGNVGVGSDVVGILEGANCISKEDYITLCGPGSSLARYGNSKRIDLKTFLPDYLKDGEVEEFIEVFEDFLNEMYDGQDGWIISATSALTITETWSSNSATSGGPTRDFTYDISGTTVDTEATDAEQIIVDWPVNSVSASPKISILEKVYRLTELHDPDLIDLEYIQYFAKNLGYNVNVYRDELGISGTYASSISANSACTDNETNRYIRFVVQNLPTWYKIKTTRNAIKVMLYSFGLVGDILEYYTSNYKSYPEGKWKIDSETDLRNIPDNWYPTPHFALIVNLDTSTDISFDLSRRDKVIRAIESIRPINTVFKRLVGYAKRTFELTTAAWIRMTRYTDIRSDGYSNSWWDGIWY
jgi:hypothetical protein